MLFRVNWPYHSDILGLVSYAGMCFQVPWELENQVSSLPLEPKESIHHGWLTLIQKFMLELVVIPVG